MEPNKEINQSKHATLQHGFEAQCQRKWNLTRK
jgi:hypothetical protein